MIAARYRHRVDEQDAGRRLDQLCARLHPEQSRSRLATLIKAQRVLLDGQAARPSERVAAGQWIDLDIPGAVDDRIEPEEIPLTVVYEDEDLLVIDKPAGLIVHPGAGVRQGTLVSALLHRDPQLAGVGGPGRCGLVHRLDRGTTGLLVIARHDVAHRALAGQFRERTVEKIYHALTWGRPREAEGEIALAVGRDPRRRVRMSTRSPRGRPAQSRYRILAQAPGFAAVEIAILTGRTHQVRVHMAAIGHPLVGDLTYAGDRSRGLIDPSKRRLVREFGRPALHARQIAFLHPRSGRRRTFRLPWPEDMRALWTGLGGVVP